MSFSLNRILEKEEWFEVPPLSEVLEQLAMLPYVSTLYPAIQKERRRHRQELRDTLAGVYLEPENSWRVMPYDPHLCANNGNFISQVFFARGKAKHCGRGRICNIRNEQSIGIIGPLLIVQCSFSFGVGLTTVSGVAALSALPRSGFQAWKKVAITVTYSVKKDAEVAPVLKGAAMSICERGTDPAWRLLAPARKGNEALLEQYGPYEEKVNRKGLYQYVNVARSIGAAKLMDSNQSWKDAARLIKKLPMK